MSIHQARASDASCPAARAATGRKHSALQLRIVREPSRKQARCFRGEFATCRRGWCRARAAVLPQAELQLCSCRRRRLDRPFEFGPRPSGTRDTSSKAPLALHGVHMTLVRMEKLATERLQLIAVPARATRAAWKVKFSLASPVASAVS
jgi:hypothetical protein